MSIHLLSFLQERRSCFVLNFFQKKCVKLDLRKHSAKVPHCWTVRDWQHCLNKVQNR